MGNSKDTLKREYFKAYSSESKEYTNPSDVNHNGAFEAGVDWTNSPNTFGRSDDDVPLAIDWNGDAIQELAIFRPGGTWFIDVNHNGAFDTGVDWTNSPNTFGGTVGDMPIVIRGW